MKRSIWVISFLPLLPSGSSNQRSFESPSRITQNGNCSKGSSTQNWSSSFPLFLEGKQSVLSGSVGLGDPPSAGIPSLALTLHFFASAALPQLHTPPLGRRYQPQTAAVLALPVGLKLPCYISSTRATAPDLVFSFPLFSIPRQRSLETVWAGFDLLILLPQPLSWWDDSLHRVPGSGSGSS